MWLQNMQYHCRNGFTCNWGNVQLPVDETLAEIIKVFVALLRMELERAFLGKFRRVSAAGTAPARANEIDMAM